MKRSRAGTQWFLTYRDLGPPSLRKGQAGDKKASKERKRKPQPEWDETIHDLSKLRLTEEELEEHRQAAVSKNLIQVPRSAVENWVPQFGYDERGRFHDHIAGPRLVSEEHSFASLRQQGKLQPWRPAGTPNFLEQLERPRIQPWHSFRQPGREDEASPSEQQEEGHESKAEHRIPKTAGGAVDFDEEVLRFEAKQRLIRSLQKGKKSAANKQGESMVEAKEKQSSLAVDEDPLTSLERGFADLEARLDQHAPARSRNDSDESSQGPPEKSESRKGEEARTSQQEETSGGKKMEIQGQEKQGTRRGSEETLEAETAASLEGEKSTGVGDSSRQGQLQNDSHLVPPTSADACTADQTQSEPAANTGMATERKEVERASSGTPSQTSPSLETHPGYVPQTSGQEALGTGGLERKGESETLTLQSNAEKSQGSNDAVQQSHSAVAALSLAESRSKGESTSREAPGKQLGQQQTGPASTPGVSGSQGAPGERTGQQQTGTASTVGVGVAVPGRRPAMVERTAPASNCKTDRERPVLAVDAMAHLERLSQGLQTCLADNRTLQSDFNEFKSHASSILTGLQLHVQKLLDMVPPSSSHVAASPSSIPSGGSADLGLDHPSTAAAPSNSPRPFEFKLPALEEDLVDSIPLPSYAELKSLNRRPDLPQTEQKRPRRLDTVRTSMGLEPVPRSLPANLRVSLRNSHASR